MIKSTVLVLTCMVLATFGPSAYASEPTFRMTTLVYDKYLIGKGKVPFRKPIMDNILSASWESGLTLVLETLKNLDNGNFDTAGDEIDFSVIYKKKVGQLVFLLELDYFDLSPLLEFGDGNLIQPILGVSRSTKVGEKHTLTPFGRFEYIIFDGKSKASGLFTRLGLTDDWQMKKDVALKHTAAILFNEGGGLGLKAGTDLLYFADLKWSVGKSKKAQIVFPSLRYSMPINRNDSRETEHSLGAGYQWRF